MRWFEGAGGLVKIGVGASRGTQQTIPISNISAPNNWPLHFVVVCLSQRLSIQLQRRFEQHQPKDQVQHSGEKRSRALEVLHRLKTSRMLSCRSWRDWRLLQEDSGQYQCCISKLCHVCFYKSQSCSETSSDQIKGKLDQLSGRYKNHLDESSTLDWADNVKVSFNAKLTQLLFFLTAICVPVRLCVCVSELLMNDKSPSCTSLACSTFQLNGRTQVQDDIKVWRCGLTWDLWMPILAIFKVKVIQNSSQSWVLYCFIVVTIKCAGYCIMILR